MAARRLAQSLTGFNSPLAQTADVTQLRVRMQSTYATPGDVSDDYQLQWEKNGNGTWTDVTTTGSEVVTYDSGLLSTGATTNRLGAGTGSFVAGRSSETGLISNYVMPASNFTEFLFSLKIISAALVPGDVIRFRVLRNGATTGLTYTQVPTLTVRQVAFTQAAFGFYAEDTESAAVALAAQNTAITREISTANADFHLRMLLQSTTTHDGDNSR